MFKTTKFIATTCITHLSIKLSILINICYRKLKYIHCVFILAKMFSMNVKGYYGCSKMKTRILTRKFLFDILAPYTKLF